LTIAELEARYRQSRDGIERSHWHILWLIAQGKRTGEVAALSGYSEQWVRALVRRYNAQGPAGVGDQRHQNPGGQRLLDAAQEQQVKAEVEAAEAQGQPWTGPQVAARMSEVIGQPVYAVRGWELLKRWQFKLKVPRPRHLKAEPAAQEAFKKPS
jgi:transposase